MRREFDTLDGSNLVVERGIAPPSDLVIVERKGWGHPDTLADHLAERLSRTYSRYTLERFGAVLHHNFDKLGLLGGASEVRYGAGRRIWRIRRRCWPSASALLRATCRTCIPGSS